MSHPTWVRGLKLYCIHSRFLPSRSHPTWVRGLKQIKCFNIHLEMFVAPYIGAWIETYYKDT